MKSWGFTINARNKNTLLEYKKMHKNVYEEISGKGGALDGLGITSMRIFTYDLKIFMIIETVDDFIPEREFERANSEFHIKVKEWDDIVHGKLLDAQHWTPMENIYYFDGNN